MYGFAPLRAAHLPLVRDWLQRPHVREWWPDPAVQFAEIETHLDDRWLDLYLMMLNDRPIGYLQCYDLRADEPKTWPAQTDGTRGIDQFIGEAELIGKGHGTALIRSFVDSLFAAGAPRVVTDPDPANARAVRCYEKAGFHRVGPLTAPWGTTLMMAREAPSLT